MAWTCCPLGIVQVSPADVHRCGHGPYGCKVLELCKLFHTSPGLFCASVFPHSLAPWGNRPSTPATPHLHIGLGPHSQSLFESPQISRCVSFLQSTWELSPGESFTERQDSLGQRSPTPGTCSWPVRSRTTYQKLPNRICGRFLWQLLAEGCHSTPVGHLLLPVLLGFHLVLLAASGPGVYGDEQSGFMCHIQQLGCKAACFDAFQPSSPLHFWVFQVILVAVPTALYMRFTLYHVIWHREESGKGKGEEEALIQGGESCRDAPGVGSLKLLWAYVAHLGARLVLEGTALGLQYHLYGFQMPSSSACRQELCPYRLTCTFSCPSEKIIFLKAIFGVGGFCLLFTLLLEIVLLGLGRLCKPLRNFLGGPLPPAMLWP
ncbi:LOW QUALITY PROTEIN: gap junction gamma-3 protein [Aotus nancymaae]|uniref:LOW QUALITY PROTEIN: gap junction gamma-3 protein n=1 Tax=Aotus nancymaae TaxID=37293 RepID=UPI0030FE749E